MFSELAKELQSAFGSLRHGTETRTLTVAKPYCSPARHIITGTLDQYGVRIYGYSEQVRTLSPAQALKNLRVKASVMESATRIMDPLPTAQVAQVTVSANAAAWAEYLLLRTGKLYCPNGYVARRNAEWAKRHGGQMPPAWKDGKPWIERSCKEGMRAWEPLRKAAAKQRHK